MLSITPQFVDPVYFYINVTADVKYNSIATTSSSEDIKSLVSSTITNYFSTDLQKFNKSYNNSKLTNLITEASSSITSTLLTIKIQRRVIPTLNTLNVFSADSAIKFRNPIKPGTVLSSYFYININGTSTLVKINDVPTDSPPSDTGSGVLRLVNIANNAVVQTNIGTVNYSTGDITITGITPTGTTSGVTDIRVTASVQEASYNLSVSRNEVLVLDDTTTNKIGGLNPGTTITVTPVV